MRYWHRNGRRWAACLTLTWTLTLLLASSAIGQSAPPPASPDPCSILREAYRLRLGDLAQARHDSTVAVARERARGDSLAVSLKWANWRLDAAKEDAPHWWEDARLSFLAGALAMAVCFTAAGRLD